MNSCSFKCLKSLGICPMMQLVLQLEVNYRNIASHFGNATMTVMDPLASNTPCEQSTEKQKQKAFFLSFLLLQRSGLDSIDFESFLSLQLFSKREYSVIFISSMSNMICSVLSAQVQHRTTNQAFFRTFFLSHFLQLTNSSPIGI